MTRYAMALLAGAGAIAVLLASTPAAASGAEATEHDQFGWTSVKFFIPNGGIERDSDCPTAQQGYGTEQWKPCHFRLVVRGWSPKAQSFFMVFSEEGEQEEAVAEMPIKGCKMTNRVLFWTVEMWTADQSWRKREHGDFEAFSLQRCPGEAPTYRTLGTSREQARKAVLDHLAPFYVSRLRCDRHRKNQNCKVTFNNSFSECRAVYQVSRYRDNVSSSNETAVTALRKRCTSF